MTNVGFIWNDPEMNPIEMCDRVLGEVYGEIQRIHNGSSKPSSATGYAVTVTLPCSSCFNVDYSEFDSRTLRAPRPKAIIEESSSLFRTRSDASLVKKRMKNKEEERNRDKQHRFSINGHFYNYKVWELRQSKPGVY